MSVSLTWRIQLCALFPVVPFPSHAPLVAFGLRLAVPRPLTSCRCAVVSGCDVSCYHPLTAYRLDAGGITFRRNERGAGDSLQIACGQCIGCRLERSRQWAMRCLHESQLHDRNCFITLTYDDLHMPEHGNLVYRDFQLFMKRLRKTFGELRFYCGGEYGETTYRPHFHACLFGFDFPDRKYYRKTPSGSRIDTSDLLDRIWGNGLCSVGDVTFESAGYIARYCVSKVTGKAADAHYTRITDDGEIIKLTPEFNKMSLKPGIGANWFSKFERDVYPHDFVAVDGVKVRPPKYYDRLLERKDELLMAEIKARREFQGYLLRSDNTPERLLAKETVTLARSNFLKRGLL